MTESKRIKQELAEQITFHNDDRNKCEKWYYNKIEELNRSITAAQDARELVQKQWESDRADKVKMF